MIIVDEIELSCSPGRMDSFRRTSELLRNNWVSFPVDISDTANMRHHSIELVTLLQCLPHDEMADFIEECLDESPQCSVLQDERELLNTQTLLTFFIHQWECSNNNILTKRHLQIHEIGSISHREKDAQNYGILEITGRPFSGESSIHPALRTSIGLLSQIAKQFNFRIEGDFINLETVNGINFYIPGVALQLIQNSSDITRDGIPEMFYTYARDLERYASNILYADEALAY